MTFRSSGRGEFEKDVRKTLQDPHGTQVQFVQDWWCTSSRKKKERSLHGSLEVILVVTMVTSKNVNDTERKR